MVTIKGLNLYAKRNGFEIHTGTLPRYYKAGRAVCMLGFSTAGPRSSFPFTPR